MAQPGHVHNDPHVPFKSWLAGFTHFFGIWGIDGTKASPLESLVEAACVGSPGTLFQASEIPAVPVSIHGAAELDIAESTARTAFLAAAFSGTLPSGIVTSTETGTIDVGGHTADVSVGAPDGEQPVGTCLAGQHWKISPIDGADLCYDYHQLYDGNTSNGFTNDWWRVPSQTGDPWPIPGGGQVFYFHQYDEVLYGAGAINLDTQLENTMLPVATANTAALIQLFAQTVDQTPPTIELHEANSSGSTILDGNATAATTLFAHVTDSAGGTSPSGIWRISLIGLGSTYESIHTYSGDASDDATFSSLDDGDYWLIAEDGLGNRTIMDVTVARHVPVISLTAGRINISSFRGTTTEDYSTLATNASITVSDASGLATLAVSGTNTSFSYSKSFSGETAFTTDSGDLTGLAPDTYVATVTNSDGNQSQITFKVVTLSIATDVASSLTTYQSQWSFSGTLVFNVSGTLDLDRVDMLDASGNVIDTEYPDSGSVTFDGLTTTLTTPPSATDMTFALYDVEGNAVSLSGELKTTSVGVDFDSTHGTFSGASVQTVATPSGSRSGIVTTSGSGEYTFPTLDLLSSGVNLLPGSVLAPPVTGILPLKGFVGADNVGGIVPFNMYYTGATGAADYSRSANISNLSLSATVDGGTSQAIESDVTVLQASCTAGGSDIGIELAVTRSPSQTTPIPIDRYLTLSLSIGDLTPLTSIGCASGPSPGGSVPATVIFNPSDTVIGQQFTTGSAIGIGVPLGVGTNQTIVLGSRMKASGVNVASDPSGSQIFAAFGGNVAMPGAYTGYKNVNGTAAYTVTPTNPTWLSGSFTMQLTYDASGLTSAQEGAIKVINIQGGTAQDVSASIDTTHHVASFTTNSFGEFLVLAPIFSAPSHASSGQLNFISNQSITAAAADSTAVQASVDILRGQGQIPVSGVYLLGPTGTTFSPPGVVTMQYSDAVLTSSGVLASSLSIYQLTQAGTFEQLKPVVVDTVNKTVSGRVDQFSSYFAVFGATAAVQRPDVNSPVSDVSYIGFSTAATDGSVLIDTATYISITASDVTVAASSVSGVSQVRYLLDETFISTTVDAGIIYTSSFTVPVGTHTLVFYSVDNAGNMEFPHQIGLTVDLVISTIPLSASENGLAMASSPGFLWEVADDSGVISLTRYSAGIASGTVVLPGALDGNWSIRVDTGSGNVYVAGPVANGADTDVAVFKVGASVVLASSSSFHAGSGTQSASFDEGNGLWIAGALRSGSISSGTFQSMLALWRYNTATSSLTLRSTYSRGAGLDMAFGVRVASGAVWVAGYSSALSVGTTNVVDLSLWKFDTATGGTLLAGPIVRSGYAPLDPFAFGRLETDGSSLFVAAERVGSSGHEALGFDVFSGSGALVSESAWESALGSSTTVSGIGKDQSGNILISGTAGMSSALWTFSPAGAFLGIQAEGIPAAINGLTNTSLGTFLSISGSSSPYHFSSAGTLAGTETQLFPPPDVTSPVSTYSIVGTQLIGAGTLYISTTTGIVLSAQDLEGPNGAAPTGVSHIDVSTDGGTYGIYAGTLTFADGIHSLTFRGIDNAGNAESTHTLTFIADGTPPSTAFTLNGTPQSTGTYSIAAGSVIGITSTDTLSGLASAYYTIDGSSPAVYASTFTLSRGSHLLSFYSIDNIGNVEAPSSATISVPITTSAMNGLAIFSAPGSLWEVATDSTGTLKILKWNSGSLGGALALPGAVNGNWSVRVDTNSNTAFVAGPVSDGAGGQDIAVFKVNSSVALVSSASFHAGNGTASASFDEGNNLWIAGALTSGSISSGTFQSKMALWHYNSGTSSLTLTATYARGAGADAAFGVRQANGAVWVAGYSSSLAPGTTTLIDLALWKYDQATGKTLQAGPFFRPSYAPFTPNIQGRLENNGSGLYIAAPHLDPSGRVDLGFDVFDFTGSLIAESLWESAVGASESIGGILIDSSTHVEIAGAAGTIPAVWTFSTIGDIVDAHASGAPGLPQGMTNTGSGPYLAVTTSSAPYKDTAVEELTDGFKILYRKPETSPLVATLLSPGAGGLAAVVKGSVEVLGSAGGLTMQHYRVEAAPGQDARSGFVLLSSGTVAVSSGVLAAWDTAGLSGWQTLRLSVHGAWNRVVAKTNVWVGDPAELMMMGSHDVFTLPQGLAAGTDGGIYVADTGADQIKVISSSKTLVASYGDGQHARDEAGDEIVSTATLRFHGPRSVAVSSGVIYVADSLDHRVVAFDRTGRVALDLGLRQPASSGQTIYAAGAGPGQFNRPSGVAVDSSGRIYVADTGNHRVQVFSSTGAFQLAFSMPAAGPGDSQDRDEDGSDVSASGKPYGVAVDGQGIIYVADPKGHRALAFGATGQLLLSIPVSWTGKGGRVTRGQPVGVAVSPSGEQIVVSDRKLHRVLAFDRLGRPTMAFGGFGRLGRLGRPGVRPPSSIFFSKPAGVALAPDGTLLVADRNHDRVERFGAPAGQDTQLLLAGEESADVARGVADVDSGGQIVRDDNAGVSVPPGAVVSDLKISVSSMSSSSAGQSVAMNARYWSHGLRPAYRAVEYGPEGTTFAAPVTLTLPYDPSLLAQAGISEDNLAVHYWNPAKNDWEALPSSVDRSNRVVTAQTTHFSLYQVLGSTGTGTSGVTVQATADPTFVFRDLYAFPNPATRSKKPTIRLQVGVADSVDIHFYDVSGANVGRASVTTPPAVLDDGNGKGPQYTYDYTWDTSGVGSGVYIYAVTAKKGGYPDIKRVKKVGVVK